MAECPSRSSARSQLSFLGFPPKKPPLPHVAPALSAPVTPPWGSQNTGVPSPRCFPLNDFLSSPRFAPSDPDPLQGPADAGFPVLLLVWGKRSGWLRAATWFPESQNHTRAWGAYGTNAPPTHAPHTHEEIALPYLPGRSLGFFPQSSGPAPRALPTSSRASLLL